MDVKDPAAVRQIAIMAGAGFK